MDDLNDVGRGVDRLLRAIGATGRDPAPALRSLLRAEGRLDRLPSDRADQLREELTSDDPIRTVAAIRAILAVQPRPALPWPGEVLPPGIDGDATATLLIEEAVDLLEQHERLRDSIAPLWPDAWIADGTGDRLRDLLAAFDEAELRFLAALEGPRSDTERELDAMARLTGDLGALERAARRAGTLGDAPVDEETDDEAERLAELTRSLAASPDALAATAAWSAFRWRHHPDRPGLDSAARDRADRLIAAGDRALDRFERSAALARSATQP